ncbi:alpha/beta hydrolase family protein [Geodermatophilus sp. SYSU D00703]
MAYAAGMRVVEVRDERTGETFPTWLLHPTDGEEREVLLGGRYPVSAVLEAPVRPGPAPLVVVSHGTGSSPFLHRELAAHLARTGFVVAAPEHPRNNRNGNDLAGTAAILRNRPSHVRAVVDEVARLHPLTGAVGVVGHSLGGYTALAVAGGRPAAFPHETPDRRPAPVPVEPDDRVRALVLLNPATPWFGTPGALAGVRVPIRLLTGTADPHTPAWQAQVLLEGVPYRAAVEHTAVPGAGHFSFLSPFPPHLVSPSLPPSVDPPGFDRAAHHPRLLADVHAFLARHLT